MIFVFKSDTKMVNHPRQVEDREVELLIHFETGAEYLSYMKENFNIAEDFTVPDIGICGMQIQDAENGILKDKNGDYPEDAIVVNTEFEIRREDTIYDSFYKPFVDYITIYNRDKSIDNLLDND